MAHRSIGTGVAVTLTLVAACHAREDRTAPVVRSSPTSTNPTVVEIVRAPWQRPGRCIEVEAMRAGRPGTIIATSDDAGARIVTDSRDGYTIREATLDCRRGSLRIGLGHDRGGARH